MLPLPLTSCIGLAWDAFCNKKTLNEKLHAVLRQENFLQTWMWLHFQHIPGLELSTGALCLYCTCRTTILALHYWKKQKRNQVMPPAGYKTWKLKNRSFCDLLHQFSTCKFLDVKFTDIFQPYLHSRRLRRAGMRIKFSNIYIHIPMQSLNGIWKWAFSLNSCN